MHEPNLPEGKLSASRREFLAALAVVPVALSVPSVDRPAHRHTSRDAEPFVPEDTYPFFTEAFPISGKPDAATDGGSMQRF
jgi:hypothetical protein